MKITISILISIFVAISVYYGNFQWQRSTTIEDGKSFEMLLKASVEISKLWHSGDVSNQVSKGNWNCPEIYPNLKLIPEDLRCDPRLINCLIEHSKTSNYLTYKRDEKVYSIQFMGEPVLIGKDKKLFPNNIEKGFKLKIQLKDQSNISLNLFLIDTCMDVYLPKRIYGYSKYDRRKRDNDWEWDNFHRNIFIDKRLVKTFEVKDWSEITGIDLSSYTQSQKMDHPAVGLTSDLMKRYCQFLGRRVLPAHIFDAASFLPMDIENPKPLRVQRGPYYWTRNSKLTKKNLPCSRIFSKECSPAKYLTTPAQKSWIGMENIMGGVFEYLPNPIEVSKNLKSSSSYFSKQSQFQKLGVRSYWNELGSKAESFDWGDSKEFEKTLKNYSIGFRCMKEEYVKN
jgi:hypothetical protein